MLFFLSLSQVKLMREVEKVLPKFVRKHLWREKHKEPNEKSTRQVASSSQTNKQTNKQTDRNAGLFPGATVRLFIDKLNCCVVFD